MSDMNIEYNMNFICKKYLPMCTTFFSKTSKMDKAMRSFKLLRLPWDHEKLEKVIDIEEVKYKTYFIQVWLTMMFLITLSFIVWCCFYVWKAEKKRGKLLRNQKHAKAVASLFKI